MSCVEQCEYVSDWYLFIGLSYGRAQFCLGLKQRHF